MAMTPLPLSADQRTYLRTAARLVWMESLPLPAAEPKPRRPRARVPAKPRMRVVTAADVAARKAEVMTKFAEGVGR
jgi:hypothetical protein